jgi:hypothetical protein
MQNREVVGEAVVPQSRAINGLCEGLNANRGSMFQRISRGRALTLPPAIRAAKNCANFEENQREISKLDTKGLF